ncbi:MAG: hypothetical protein K8S87_00695 [Planctomycetes bacterium]|nr:hypothetical protein [Planctomycetota bacterium]
MRLIKGFMCFMLTLSYIALGILLYSHFNNDFLHLFEKIRFTQALIVVMGISNILHLKYWFFTKLMHKKMKKTGKFDHFIDDKFKNKHCC